MPNSVPPPFHVSGPAATQSHVVLHAEAIEPALHGREWSAGGSGAAQLFLVLSRRGVLTDAGGRIELLAPALAWLPGDGRARTVLLEAGARGLRLSVANDALAAAISGVAGVGRLRRRLSGSATVRAARLAPFAEEVAQSVRALAREVASPGGGSPAILAAHLALICLHVERLSDVDAREAGPERAGSVAQRFGRLVEVHARDGWTVKRYAAALGVTGDRLQSACLRENGRPPSVIIRDRLVADVRTQLEGTQLPVEQIAFALGFRDPSYFSRFCRKHLNAPPGRYRRDAKALSRRPTPGSYAAWP